LGGLVGNKESEVEKGNMTLSRRSFLGGVMVATAGFALKETPAPPLRSPVYDFHVHLFGIGDGGTRCYFSTKQREHWNYPFFLKLLNISENGRLDQDYVKELVRQLRDSSISRAVLLSYDGCYDTQGRFDRDATRVYVPNEYLFRVVADHPDLFVPCASINPKRRDAIEQLDYCAESGARVLKIHPPIQDVDPAEERFRPFYRRLAKHGIILMVHTGMEPAPGVVGHAVSDPARLATALEEGCTVVAAHAGMGGFFDKKEEYQHFFPNLVGLMGRFPKLYCDTSFIASMLYWRAFPRLLEESTVLDRTIYASDWPWPSTALVFWNRLAPGKLLALCSEANLFERDYRLKQALGLPVEAFERGAQLLM
jgi:predicted TIM-barrel fold metal-dependent hydrolase